MRGCREEAQELRLAHERLTDLATASWRHRRISRPGSWRGYRDVKPADAFRPGSLRSSACSR